MPDPGSYFRGNVSIDFENGTIAIDRFLPREAITENNDHLRNREYQHVRGRSEAVEAEAEDIESMFGESALWPEPAGSSDLDRSAHTASLARSGGKGGRPKTHDWPRVHGFIAEGIDELGAEASQAEVVRFVQERCETAGLPIPDTREIEKLVAPSLATARKLAERFKPRPPN